MKDGALRVLDWGDASIGHPFFSLFETFRFLVELNRIPPGDRWFARLTDAYLEPWGTRSSCDVRPRASGRWSRACDRMAPSAGCAARGGSTRVRHRVLPYPPTRLASGLPPLRHLTEILTRARRNRCETVGRCSGAQAAACRSLSDLRSTPGGAGNTSRAPLEQTPSGACWSGGSPAEAKRQRPPAANGSARERRLRERALRSDSLLSPDLPREI